MADPAFVAETRRLMALAETHTAAGDHGTAADAYGAVARRHPGVGIGWLQAAVAAHRAGRAVPGRDHARHALILDPSHAAGTTVLAAAEAGESADRRHGATAMWAITNPTNAAAQGALASSHQQAGRFRPAELAGRAALRLDPTLAWVRANLAVVLREQTKVEAAMAELRRAAVCAPGDGLVWRRVAGLREILSDLTGAETAAKRALRIEPGDHAAQFFMALAERRQGRLQDALDRLRGLPKRLDGEVGRDAVEFELGTLFDRLGQPAVAYDHFVEGNRIAVSRAAPGSADPSSYLDTVAAFEEAMEERWVDRWTRLEPSAAPVVFMVGFPRSGTTLLDQVLDAHPDAHVVEEHPVLAGLGASFVQPFDTLPHRLANLSDDQASRLRAGLAARLERWAGRDLPPVVVDKMPLNTIYLPLALRLFPRAKVILSVRHPCDCCLSCFMQPIRLNPAMASFTSLDAATALYARVMGLWERVAARLSPDHEIVRYEDLIADVEGTARRVLDFVGLEWDDRVVDHTRHARTRGLIRTPSFRQVSEPIYTRARGRWENYRSQMTPYLDRLRPYITSFGYDDPS